MNIKTAVIIAEYNPFHTGHRLHINETRRLFGASHIIAIMSGNFVQRGDCACASKWVRAEMALRSGADLVIELPTPWAAAGAEKFAQGGVSLANALGCADMLSFGSESADIEAIKSAAALLTDEKFGALLREKMNGGVTFASAREQAARELLPEAAEILSNPNDTLGVEYCKAILAAGAQIEPMCIKREGASHDSDEQAEYVSASYIRKKLADGEIIKNIPDEAAKILQAAIDSGCAPARLERLDRAILCRLREMTAEEIALLPDISEGLENRIYKCSRTARSFEELCDEIKVKRYTHARIRRIILSALLGVTAQDAAGTPPYIRILGMNERGREILKNAKPTLPIITRYADVSGLDERGRRIFELECRAWDIFALTTPEVQPCGADMTAKMIVL